MRIVATTFLALALLSGSAAAQTIDRGYVQGIGGIAVTSATDQFFGGAGAIRAAGPVEAFVELGRLRNGIWSALDDELSAARARILDQIAAQFGTAPNVSFDATVPIIYGLGGIRVRGPALGPLASYVEGGVGLARLRPDVDLEIAGQALDAEVSRLLQLEGERTEVMSAVGGGVFVNVLRRIRLESGYRLSRIHGDLGVTVNRVHFGVGYAF